MRLPRISSLFLAALFVVCSFQLAMGQSRDYGLWTGAEVNSQVAKHLKLHLSGEVRLNDTLSNVDALLAKFGVSIKLNKHFGIIGEYRLGRQAESSNSYNTTNRFSLGAKTDWNMSRLKVAYQLRYDYEFTSVYSDGYNLDESKQLRNKAILSYNLPNTKVEPFVLCELYYDLSPYKEREFNKVRYRIGADIPMNKHHALEIFLQYQKKLNGKNNASSLVLGLFYSFEMKAKNRPLEIEESKLSARADMLSVRTSPALEQI